MVQKIEIEIDVPEGYEFVRYGVPELGEEYLWHGHLNMREIACNANKYFIVRKIKQKRWRTPVLPADWGKECEFSDGGEAWKVSKLHGYEKGDDDDAYVWCSCEGHYYIYCRIACDE